MGQLFGTDGIRGKANRYPITSEVALKLGKAIAHVFGAKGGTMKAIIGKDTRLSGYMLETALTSGLVSMGMDVLEVGPMPTPAVAHLTRSMGASCGIMITASHNPSSDNGIKIFAADGFKLPDALEDEIEQYILGDEISTDHIATSELGKAYRIDDARGRYIEFAKSSIKNFQLKGLKVVLDCANGSAYSIAPPIFKELGVEVITTAVSPDGHNINAKCGATYVENVAKLVKEHGADVGISFDGDADRVIFCDAAGNEVNGDRIIGLCALDFKRRNRLANNHVVLTCMSNLGLIKAMHNADIETAITTVGDRYVIEEMKRGEYNFGGEQSGHIIFMDYATTGDGIISALHVLKIMVKSGKTLAELADFMREYPQTLLNINVSEKPPVEDVPELVEVIEKAERAMGETGRCLIRYSGTENKIRVLVEAKEEDVVDHWINEIKTVIENVLV
jgi:phosphoglucosamine mutase